MTSIWTTIFFSALLSYFLRALPFLIESGVKNLPDSFYRVSYLAGYAVIGSMMSEAVFAPLFSNQSDGLAYTDMVLRLLCTVGALFLMKRLKNQVVSLLVSYSVFVFLYFYLVARG